MALEARVRATDEALLLISVCGIPYKMLEHSIPSSNAPGEGGQTWWMSNRDFCHDQVKDYPYRAWLQTL